MSNQVEGLAFARAWMLREAPLAPVDTNASGAAILERSLAALRAKLAPDANLRTKAWGIVAATQTVLGEPLARPETAESLLWSTSLVRGRGHVFVHQLMHSVLATELGLAATLAWQGQRMLTIVRDGDAHVWLDPLVAEAVSEAPRPEPTDLLVATSSVALQRWLRLLAGMYGHDAQLEQAVYVLECLAGLLPNDASVQRRYRELSARLVMAN